MLLLFADKVNLSSTLRKTAGEAGEMVFDNPQSAEKYVSIPLFICLNIMHCIIKYNTVHE
jgi:hypothetical protein